MKILSPTIFLLLFQFAFLSGFSQQVESLHSIKIGVPGATYSYEHALGKQFSKNMEAGVNLGWLNSNHNTTLLFRPIFVIEPRFYYNVIRRHKDDRFINNSASFFSLKAPSLREVTVMSNRSSNFGSDLNRTSIPMSRIKEMPPFLGEYDLFKALALTPGVNSGTDGSSSLFVRGGSSDQNLVLLDGATIYSNSHLFGFISVFNPEAISHAEYSRGIFPQGMGAGCRQYLTLP